MFVSSKLLSSILVSEGDSYSKAEELPIVERTFAHSGLGVLNGPSLLRSDLIPGLAEGILECSQSLHLKPPVEWYGALQTILNSQENGQLRVKAAHNLLS